MDIELVFPDKTVAMLKTEVNIFEKLKIKNKLEVPNITQLNVKKKNGLETKQQSLWWQCFHSHDIIKCHQYHDGVNGDLRANFIDKQFSVMLQNSSNETGKILFDSNPWRAQAKNAME